jgi:uncharacterized membrane protein
MGKRYTPPRIGLGIIVGCIPLLVASGYLFEVLADAPLVEEKSRMAAFPLAMILFALPTVASFLVLIFLLDEFHKWVGGALAIGILLALLSIKLGFRLMRQDRED